MSGLRVGGKRLCVHGDAPAPKTAEEVVAEAAALKSRRSVESQLVDGQLAEAAANTSIAAAIMEANKTMLSTIVQELREDSERRDARHSEERKQDLELRNNHEAEKLQRSVIKIHPTIKWPILEDTDSNPKEFFTEFEWVCGLCNADVFSC